MKITFLGTNGWYDTKTGNTICTLVETKDYFIIFDAGNGFYKIDKYIKDSKKPIYLFLSHFHLEHIIGLHILSKFNFSQGIHIYGQIGTRDFLGTIVNQPYTAPIAKLPFKIEIHDLAEGVHKIPFLVKCMFLVHASSCLGYRIEIDGKVISYCTDTGICKNLLKLAKGADILIAECGVKVGEKILKDWPHLGPKDVARIAKKTGVKKLAMVHFLADKYLNLNERKKSEKEARKIFKNTIATVDGMQIEI